MSELRDQERKSFYESINREIKMSKKAEDYVNSFDCFETYVGVNKLTHRRVAINAFDHQQAKLDILTTCDWDPMSPYEDCRGCNNRELLKEKENEKPSSR